jgi:2-hydroxy-3-oxopropionate reductase
MANIGFIGLGIMGAPMAGHLKAAGHRVHSWSRSKAAPVLAAEGLLPCDSPRAVAAASETIITMVSDTPDVAEVLFAEQGVAAGLKPGKLVIDMSSISPIATRDFAKRIEALGCDYVDAPVSGGDIGAKAATLTIMVGAKPAAFERARPLLEKLGKNITLIGDVGAGQTAKVANQIMVALNLAAVGEALLFAAKAGVDPAKVRQALLGGFAASRVLEVHGEKMIRRNFTPGFRIELHQKDLGLALEGARALRMSLPNTAAVAQLMNAAQAQGLGKLDNSALVQVLEQLAGFQMAGSQLASVNEACKQ